MKPKNYYLTLLRTYAKRIQKGNYHFYVGEDIPDNLIKNASYAIQAPRQTILGLYDTTIVQNGKYGYVITDSAIYRHISFSKPCVVRFSEIKEVFLPRDTKKGTIEKDAICLRLSSGQLVTWYDGDVNWNPFCDFLRIVIANKETHLDVPVYEGELSSFDGLLEKLPPCHVDITDKNTVKKIQRIFPVPNDFEIVWADILSYGGYPAGVVITKQALIIKAPKAVVKETNAKNKTKKSSEIKTIYQVIPWAYFDARDYQITYTGDGMGYAIFSAGSEIARFSSGDLNQFFNNCAYNAAAEEAYADTADIAAGFASMGIGSLPNLQFHVAYGAGNSQTGHGIYAEVVGSRLDNLCGEDSVLQGQDNAKNGADKMVNGNPVQVKFYRTASESVGACFETDSITGHRRYKYLTNDNRPMQVEVPRDQYEKAIESMKKHIADGDVPGVTDPEDAYKIVRKSKLTQKQAYNLAHAGAIESITYDAITGAVHCATIAGLSATVSFALTLWKTKDIKSAARAALRTGIDVFGVSFPGYLLASQLARTNLPNQFASAISSKLDPKTVQDIVNAFRSLLGKCNIYGSAARKSLEKALRVSVFTQVVMVVVSAIPDTYRLIGKKVSAAQYTKNISSMLSSVAMTAVTTYVTGKVVGKIGEAIGEEINEDFGKVIGYVAGFVGGAIGGFTTRTIGNLIREDDVIISTRLINAVVANMCIDYMLLDDEMDELIKKLDKAQDKLKDLQVGYLSSEKQYEDIEKFFEPYFEEIVRARKQVTLLDETSSYVAIGEIILEAADEISST